MGESIHIRYIIPLLGIVFLLCTGVASGYTQDDIFKSVKESTPELTRFIVDTKIPITEMKMQFNELQGRVISYNIQKDVDGSYKLSAIINPSVKDGRLGYQIDAIPVAKTDKGDVIGTKYLWWNVTWAYCRNITILGPMSTLANYPLFIHLTNTSHMMADGRDIRFVNTSCGNDGDLLKYEIENITTNSVDAWVKIPSLATGNTVISIYFNSTASDSQDKVNTWNSIYLGVWHHNNGTGTTLTDSFGSHTATLTASTHWGTGQVIDGMFNYDGSADYATTADSADFDGSSGLTLEGWINTSKTTRGDILAHYDPSSPYNGFCFSTSQTTSGDVSFFDPGAVAWLNWASTGVNNGNVHYVVISYNTNKSVYLYMDGIQFGTAKSITTLASMDGPGNLVIGANSGSSKSYKINGMMDEVRLSKNRLSPDWINYTYATISNNAGMIMISGQAAYLPPQNFSIYSPVNSSYNISSIAINYTASNSTDPVSYQINLHNASNNVFLWTIANNAGFLNYLWTPNATEGQYKICVIANNSIGETASNCSLTFSLVTIHNISFFETIPTFNVLPNIAYTGNYTYSDHTGVTMTSNCSFLTIKPDNYSSPFTRYYDYDCSPFMSGGIVSLTDLTHTAVIYQSDYTPVRFYLYDKIRFQGLCGDTTMTYNLHEWDQYGDGSFDWDSGTFLNSYFYYDHTQLGDPYAVTLREGNTDADYYEGHGFNPGGLIILDAQPYNISYTRNISQYGNNYCRLNVTGANASNLSNTFLVNVTDTPPVFNDTYNLTSTTENYTHIVMGYDPENDPFTGLGCNISGMTISWILIPINTTSCCNVTLNDTVMINETEYCYTHVSTPPEPSYTMKYLDCDIDDTSKIILYFICFIICIFSTIILLWLRLGILEIIGGFIMIFIGGYFFSCFMFCIAMFVCAGLSLMCKGLTDIS